MRLSILIPAYQEERTIAEVLRRVAAADTESIGFDKEILVCDDGSRDRTVACVEEVMRDHASIRLLRHPRNRGKGAAIRTALDEARGDYVLIQDADLEYDVADYPALLLAVKDGAEAVYGSRFLRKGYPDGMRVPNYVANRLLSGTANLLFGHAITDEATCFKVVRTDLLRSLGLTCERFEFCPEVTAKLGKRRVKIIEVPVRYTARTSAEGKKVAWHDGLEAMWVLLRERVRRP
jgi:glycosyltransferase involved in cell wall biosynthesis